MTTQLISLITGANKGIGFEVARQLATLGHSIIIGARDEASGRQAAEKLRSNGHRAVHALIDVTDRVTADAAAKQIDIQFGRLDVLINNAGISIDARTVPSKLGLDILRRTFETNAFGAVTMIQSMLPLLLRSEGARIVNVSSGLGSLTQNCDPEYEFAAVKLLAYNSSKTALNAFTIQFSHELRNTNIKVNSADPGFTATDLNGHRGTRTVEQAAKVIVHLATLPASGPSGGFFDENGPIAW